jgi:hypothetical protein
MSDKIFVILRFAQNNMAFHFLDREDTQKNGA